MADNSFDNIIPEIYSIQKRILIPDAASLEHMARFNDIIYVHYGSVTYVVNGVRYPLHAGNAAFIPKGCLKRSFLENGDIVSLYTCLFTYSFTEGNFLQLPFPMIININGDAEFLKLLTHLHEVWTEKSDRYLLRSRAILMLLLDKLFSYVKVTSSTALTINKHVRKIQKYIINHYNDKIRIDDLSRLTGLHPVYISSLFKESTGSTLKEYITMIRINKAMDLLSFSEFKIGEVAYQCGFDDVLYFSKVFKKVTGIPPSVYIRCENNQ